MPSPKQQKNGYEKQKKKPNWTSKDMVHNPNIKSRKEEIGPYC